MKPYAVSPILFSDAREFIRLHHYAKGLHNGPTGCFGLFDGQHLIGVAVFATPCSENVRASVFGTEHRQRVTELHRFCLIDETPKNTESWFLRRAFAQLKAARSDLWAAISFADTSAGHVGTIYQATNGYYAGTVPGRTAYIDATGRLRHRRQCGRNIALAEALGLGWRPIRGGVKHRYLLLLPDDRRHRPILRSAIRLPEVRPYPKLGYNTGRLSDVARSS